MDDQLYPRTGRARGRTAGDSPELINRHEQRPGFVSNPNYLGNYSTDGSTIANQFSGLTIDDPNAILIEELTRDMPPWGHDDLGPSISLGRGFNNRIDVQNSAVTAGPHSASITSVKRDGNLKDHILSNIDASRDLQSLSEIYTKKRPIQDKKGTTGREIPLQANYFRLCDNTNWMLYQYLVEFNPPKELISVRKTLLKGHRQELGAFIYNGTHLYSSRMYPPESMSLLSVRPTDNSKVVIKLQFMQQVPHNHPLTTRICTALLRKCLASLRLQIVGTNYYNPNAKFALSEERQKLEIWPGFIIRIQQHENEMLLCIEITHKVIRSETVLDMLSMFRHRGLVGRKQLQEAVQGLVVRTSYNTNCYNITDIDLDVNPDSRFELADGTFMTYTRYYKERYNIDIRDKDQPLLVSSHRGKTDLQGDTDKVYLVPELCNLTGIPLDRMDMFLMRAVTEKTSIEPSRHLDAVIKICQDIIETTPALEILQDWNMQLKCEPVQFQGRVLPFEPVHVGRGSGYKDLVVEFNGSEFHLRPMLVPVALHTWVVMYPCEMKRETYDFIRMLQKTASSLNMQISEPRMVEMSDDGANTYIKHLDKVITTGNTPQIIVCVASNNREDRYRAIKRKCCVEHAVPTQVVTKKAMDLSWKTTPIARRVAAQINTKLGGIPWGVDIPLKGLMTVGVDVMVNPFIKTTKVVALVASMNNQYTRFYSGSNIYYSFEDLANQICHQLNLAVKNYQKHNEGKFPKYIVLYRDGVAKKHAEEVCETEVQLIKKSLAKIYGSEPWRLAYIIISKHSNTRIFSRNGHNPPLGTVVDDVITRPERYDFFLMSSQILRYTVFPTMYNVISDNTGLTADKMQRLTYKLTHLYFNIKATNRTPAPVRYAQRLAQLTCLHLQRSPNPGLCDVLYFL